MKDIHLFNSNVNFQENNSNYRNYENETLGTPYIHNQNDIIYSTENYNRIIGDSTPNEYILSKTRYVFFFIIYIYMEYENGDTMNLFYYCRSIDISLVYLLIYQNKILIHILDLKMDIIILRQNLHIFLELEIVCLQFHQSIFQN